MRREEDEMRLEVGVNESSKNKLVRSTWAGDVVQMADKTVREQMPRKWRGNGGEAEEDR